MGHDGATADPLPSIAWGGKLSPPGQPAGSVPRTRLVENLVGDGTPILLIVAPAGFGKTMLMRQLYDASAARGIDTGWLSLSRRDNDPGRFLSFLAAAFAPFAPPATLRQPSDTSLFDAHNRPQDAAMALLDRIAAIARPFCLFIDDFENLTSPEVIRFVQDLIETLRPHQRIVIGSRSMTTMPLTALYVRGQVRRISADDLRFDRDEAEHFFSGTNLPQLSPTDLAGLSRRLDGWAAGFRLIALALPNIPDPGKWLETLSGRMSDVSDYLADNVLRHLGDLKRDFIVRTSPLDLLNGELCDHVLDRTGSAALLEELYHANVFLTRIGDGSDSYRFHPLFRDFLLGELKRQTRDSATQTLLHRRAAGWYRDRRHFAPAVDHALAAEDHGLAAAIVDECAPDFVGRSQVAILADWLDAIPEAYIGDLVNVQVARANVMTNLLRFDDARDALRRLQHIATSQGRKNDPYADVQLALLNEWTDRPDLTEIELQRSAGGTMPADGPLFGIRQNIEAYHAILKGHFNEARRTLAQAKSVSRTAPFVSAFTLCFEGVTDLIQGNARAACERFETAFRDASHASLGIAGAYLMEVRYERNDCEGASRIADDTLHWLRASGTPDSLIVGFRTAARLAMASGRKDDAEAHLAELADIGALKTMPRLKMASWLEKCRLALLAQDIDHAQRFLALALEERGWQHRTLPVRFPHETDDLDIAMIRCDLVSGDTEAATARLLPLIGEAEQMGRSWRAFRLKALLAQAYVAQRRRSLALRMLEEALLSAGKYGFVRVFADEPWFLADLLDELSERNKRIDRLYIASIRTALPDNRLRSDLAAPAATSDTDLLSTKELRLMRLVSDGLSNKDIARQLDITDNTVETHLRRINRKLGTRKRTEAIARLRDIGMIG